MSVEAALEHAAAGRPVFPCDARKRPLVKDWPNQATADPAQITAWWAQWPDAYIGMPTGPLSGIVVLDIDVKGGHDGEGSLTALLRQHGGAVPETVEVLTPSGGRHVWFQYPRNSRIRNSAGKLGDGLDVRGDGGYVVLPGSGINGARYEFEGSSDPAEGAETAPLPPWLYRLLVAADTPPEPEGAEPGRNLIPSGKRNSVLAALAGGMRRQGLDHEAIGAALLAINAARCRPPLPDAEVRTIAQSIGRYEPADRPHEGPPALEALVPEPDEVSTAKLAPRCIVDQYLYADVAQLIAPGGTGKTTLLLYEAACIALGRRLYGSSVSAGRSLLVTAEDNRERLLARLREICAAMELGQADTRRVFESVLIWDVTGTGLKLASVSDGNIRPTPLAEQIAGAYRDADLALIQFDPLVSFGASEQAVNDNEQAIITAARAIVRELDCCVRFVHHTGKGNARAGAVDQYSGRGGSAMADGTRMTAVLQRLDDAEGLRPPPGCAVEPGADITVLHRPKVSYAPPNLPAVFVRRRGFEYEHFLELRQSPEEAASAKADQLERFLISQFKAGRYWTKRQLEDIGRNEMDMTKAELRRAVVELEVSGRIAAAPLPPELRQGSRQSFLCPANCAGSVAELGAVGKTAAP